MANVQGMIRGGNVAGMKKLFLLCCSLVYFIPVQAQKNDDLGIFAGTSYYLGELNPSGHFQPLNPSLGLLYRHNFNPHHSLRWNLNYVRTSAQKPDMEYLYNRTSFTSSLVDMALQFEFNFMPFKPYTRFIQQTTYVSGGAGMAIAGKPGGTGYEFVIPFGLGWKLNINDRFSMALAWEFRKTFFDDLDGVHTLNDPSYSSFMHNNDWYAFAGLIITYNLFNLKTPCPAYGDY